MSLRRNLTQSLEKLSSEIRRVSLRSPVYSCITFVRCCRGWIHLMNQHMARSKPVRPVSTNHSIRLIAREVLRSEGREAWDRHVKTSAAAPSTKSGYDVGEPLARTDLEAYGAAVSKLLLAVSGFMFDGEEVHRQ